MTDPLEELFQSYFNMSEGAKMTVQKTLFMRLMDVKDEMNENLLPIEDPYTIEQILDLAEKRYITNQQFELAGIVRDIRQKITDVS